MRTLLIFSGGGCPGLDIHAGIGMALSEFGIVPDEIHGTSAGAIYGALFAHHAFSGIPPANIIRRLTDDDARDPRFMWRSRFRHLSHIHRGRKMAAIIDRELPQEFADLPCRMFAWTVEGGSGRPVYFNSGDLRRAVRASASIRGIFPPVAMPSPAYTTFYSDGGTKNNIPLPGWWMEFDRIIVCVATQPVNYQGKGLLFHSMLSVHELMEGHYDRLLAQTCDDPRVLIIRPEVDGKTGTMHFNHDLIDIAFSQARSILHDRLYR